MLDTPLSEVVSRYIAISQVWNPSLLDCITVPVRTLNRRRQVRQRNGIVLWAHPVWTSIEPHQWQAMPSGQRCSMNHRSAAASSG